MSQPGNQELRYVGERWCLIKYYCLGTGPQGMCDLFHECYVPQPPQFLGQYEYWVDTLEGC